MVKLPNQDVKDYLHFDKLAALRELLSPACSRLTGESACPTEQSSTRAAPPEQNRLRLREPRVHHLSAPCYPQGHFVAGLEIPGRVAGEAHAGRRPGRDDVAGLQGEHAR